MNTQVLECPSITDVPNYDCVPGYEVISQATYEHFGMIKLLSGHEAYHVMNYHDVKKILTNASCIRSPSNSPEGPSILPTLTPKDLLLNLDFPEHGRMKRFVAKDYSTSGLSWLKEYIKDATENLIMEKTITGTFDLYKDTLDPVAIKINCHLLGIPIEEKDYFRVFSVTVQKSDKKNVVDLIEKFEKLYAYLYEHVTGKREHYKHGLISKFLSLRESAEPPLNNEELTAILLGSLLGGDQNVLTVMTKIFYALLYLRNLWQFISLNPIYIPAVVEELVRLTNLGDASAFPRIAISDIELSNGNIPAGSAIYPDVFLANRDPSVFPEPLIINPFRNSVRHLQFGYGMHHCMGQELARLEICSIISVVTELLPNLGLAAGKSPKDYAWDEGIILRRPKELPVQTL